MQILLPMALCADARLDGENLIGDPTEGALIVLAEKGGVSIEGSRSEYPRVAEVPFNSDYKFMATFHNMTNEKGKPVVRCLCQRCAGRTDRPQRLILDARQARCCRSLTITATWHSQKMNALQQRVSGSWSWHGRDFDPATFDPQGKLIDLMTDLTLLAMVGIVDPPRTEAKEAIAKCHSAGIQVRMITGDHAVTAAAIGKELGITGTALSGAEFAAMSDEALTKDLDNIGVIARVAPEDKIRLVISAAAQEQYRRHDRGRR